MEFVVVVENTPSWAAFKPEIAKKNGIEYHRKRGSKIIYKQKEVGFECVDCSSEIMAAQAAHPIHGGPQIARVMCPSLQSTHDSFSTLCFLLFYWV